MKKIYSTLILAICVASVNAVAAPNAWKSPKIGAMEVGFSPQGNAENLVIKTINSAEKEIRILSYSFTSANVVKALLKAKKRGVDIYLVSDASNLKKRYSMSALSTLATAGVDIRTVDAFAILHDKVLVVDRKHVETGSFNYSKAAANSNSENVVVFWDAPELAYAYLEHWKSRWDLGAKFKPNY